MCSKLKFKDSPDKCLVKSAECSKLAVQCTLDDPWTFYCFMCSCCLEPTFWDGNGKNYRQISHIFYNCLRCVLCASSCFSNRLPPARLWPRPWNRTPVWLMWICSRTTSALKGQRLGVWWWWCHEGRGCEETQRKGQGTAVWKWGQGNDERQRSAVLVLRCAKYITEVCDDNWLRIAKIIKIEYLQKKK